MKNSIRLLILTSMIISSFVFFNLSFDRINFGEEQGINPVMGLLMTVIMGAIAFIYAAWCSVMIERESDIMAVEVRVLKCKCNIDEHGNYIGPDIDSMLDRD